MSKQKAYVSLLLDRSGSMQANKLETVSAISEYIEGLKSQFKGVFTLTQFDSNSIDVDHHEIKIKEIPEFTDFNPRGGTPLLDAIGKTVHAMNAEGYDNVVVVIVTDGQENASREYAREAIQALIKEKTEKEWQFLYLGANVDSFAEASQLGIARGQTMNYAATHTTAAMTTVLDSSSRYASRVKGDGIGAGNFSDEERKKAVGDSA